MGVLPFQQATFETSTKHHRLRARRLAVPHFTRLSPVNCSIDASQSTNVLQRTRTLAQHIKQFGFAQGFADKFCVGEHLGSGSFGAVYIAVDRASGERFAVKTIKKRFFGGYLEPNFMRRIQHEVDIYNRLGRSLNVAHMYNAYEDDRCVNLVMELCTGGELWSRIRRGQYSEQDASRIMREVMQTIAQCHAKGVLIRDVKPENFLFLDSKDTSPLKMIDFGMAVYCTPGQALSDRAGTPFYVAPEVLRQHYGLKADVWSAGVIAYQLLAARLPFTDEEGRPLLKSTLSVSKHTISNKEVFTAVLRSRLDFTSPPWDAVSEPARNFVLRLLQRDPEARPSADEALQHPWLRGADGTSSTGNSGAVVPDKPLSDTLVQRLQRYGTYGKLKQTALKAVASFLIGEDSKLQQLQRAFRSVDAERTGKLPYSQVADLLQSGQFDLSPTEVQHLLSQFEIDAAGHVDYTAWLAALLDWREVQQSEEWDTWVARVFDIFDVDHSGRVSAEDLEQLLCHGGCPVADTVPAAMRQVSHAAAASIDFEEFTRMLRSAQEDSLDLFESRRVWPTPCDQQPMQQQNPTEAQPTPTPS